jgi:hypothetical protein
VAYLLRQIKYNRWLFDDEEDWIARGKAPADIAADFAAEKNRLSLWVVDEEQTNLTRVILALVGNRSNLQHFEYVLFDQSILERCGIVGEQTPGDVPDPDIARVHIDINVEDIDGLAQLARSIWLSPTKELVRTITTDIVSMSYSAFNLGTFRQEYCKPNVFAELQRKWGQLTQK